MNLNNFLLNISPAFINFAALLIRLFIGICFIIHGLGKLGLVGSGNMTGFEGWLKSLGVPFAKLQARLAMIFEVVGGVLMTIGLFTRVGALLCFFTMIVAAFIGHKGGGYLITNNPPGNEYAINLAVILVVLVLIGPGIYSLDFLLF